MSKPYIEEIEKKLKYNIKNEEFIADFNYNNKTVFGKEFSIGNLPNNSTADYLTDISTNYKICKIEGIATDEAWGYYTLPFVSPTSSDNIGVWAVKINAEDDYWHIRTKTGMNRSSLKANVNIYYIKD